jgi:hypothetical protein
MNKTYKLIIINPITYRSHNRYFTISHLSNLASRITGAIEGVEDTIPIRDLPPRGEWDIVLTTP